MLGTLSEPEIETVLRRGIVGRIGCHADGRTYIVPITYAYDEKAIYAHTAEGLKLRMMRANPNVCFEVDHMEDLANWQSVIAWGRFEELRGSDADHAMALLLARLLLLPASSETSHPPKSLTHQNRVLEDGLEAVVYRIHITEMSGRYERIGPVIS